MENKSPKPIDISNLHWQQVVEIDACTRCGECVKWCPVYVFDQREDITPRAKLLRFREILRAQNSILRKFIKPNTFLAKIFNIKEITEDDIREFAESLYECSTCRQCHFVCPARIDTVNLYEAIRRALVDAGYGPLKNHQALVASTKSFDNPWKQTRSQRDRWARVAKRAKLIKEIPTIIKPPKNSSKKEKEETKG